MTDRSSTVFFRRDEEHEWKCIKAIRHREHPAWSRFRCGYEVKAA